MRAGLDEVNTKLGRLGKVSASAGSIIKGALIGGAVIKGVQVLGDRFRAANEAVQLQEKLAAQTGAVLKSTGGAAGVTATQVGKLADAIERKSMLDAEAVQDGQNLLLTFTNIRNEAGKGNDIFNQTVQTMADLSTAMGQSTRTSAQQLGKALNDPVKGVSALSRVGVTFTDQQKEQIKTLVASGRTMDAQKVILGELSKEFGGSAKAAGQTAAGQWKHLNDMIDGVFETIVKKAVPVLLKVATYLSKELPKAIDAVSPYAQKIADIFMNQVLPPLQVVFNFMRNNKPVVIAFAAVLGVAAVALGVITVATAAFNAVLALNPIGLVVIAIAALAAALVYAYNRSEKFRAVVDKAWSFIKAATSKVWPVVSKVVTTYIKILFTVIKTYFKIYSTIIKTVWTVIKTLTKVAWAGIKTTIINPVKAIYEFIKTSFNKMKDGVSESISKIVSVVKGIKDRVFSALSGAATWLFEIGKKIIQGLIDGIKSMAGSIKGAIDAVIPDIPGVSLGGFGRVAAVPVPSSDTITVNVYPQPFTDPAMAGKAAVEAIDTYYRTGGRTLRRV